MLIAKTQEEAERQQAAIKVTRAVLSELDWTYCCGNSRWVAMCMRTELER